MSDPGSFEIGDEYDGDSRASEDCSDEFEQGLEGFEDEALLTQARARMDAFWLSRVMK
jgi:hypothetical protein